MKLKNKVCTLEQSKKLDDLGVRIEAENVWYSRQNPKYMTLQKFYPMMRISGAGYFAPDVPELMEMLPSSIEHKGITYHLNVSKDTVYDIDYWNAGIDSFLCDLENKILSHGLADCLIWSIENNHLKVEELNQ